VSRDGVEVGADAPLREGQRIVRMPEAAAIVGDAEMQLTAVGARPAIRDRPPEDRRDEASGIQ
jgi:hypothetical protein